MSCFQLPPPNLLRSNLTVSFPSHCRFSVAFSPAAVAAAPPPPPAASSPRIFAAAMNLHTGTKEDQPTRSQDSVAQSGFHHPTPSRKQATKRHRLLLPSRASLPGIRQREGKERKNGQLTRHPTMRPSPAHTRPARPSCRLDSPCRPGGHSVAPAARADGCIVCCG